MEEKTLSGWLKEKCQNERLSLRQAGERAGLSHSTVHAIIRGGHASAGTVTKLAHAFGGNGQQGVALEDELLTLAGYRTSREHISQPLAELMDTVSGFSESQLRVVIAFAVYLRDK